MEPLIGNVSDPLEPEVAVKRYADFVQLNIFSHRFGYELSEVLLERQVFWFNFDQTSELRKYREGALPRQSISLVISLPEAQTCQDWPLPVNEVALWR